MEDRIRRRLHEGEPRSFERIRTLLVMERFMARVVHVLPNAAVLKGGLALELRLDKARTTRDIDLRLAGNPSQLQAQIVQMETYRPIPEDHLQFTVTADPKHPDLMGDSVRYEGRRFRVKAAIASKLYASFALDMAYGDPILGDPDLLTGSDFFARYGIPSVQVPTYPIATHFAEKLHAYTVPRPRTNTRLKDLVDIALMAELLAERDPEELKEAIALTFEFRGTHPVPATLQDPPALWRERYPRLAIEEALPWQDLASVFEMVVALTKPLLHKASQ